MRGIGRNVFLIGLVSLFTDLGSKMVFPLIPLYLTSVLGAPVVVVGLVEGAAESLASLLKVVSGRWSDRVGKRKPFIFVGYTLSGFAKPLFALAGAWPVVLGLRLVERMGKGVRGAPRDALVADSSEATSRGKAFGLHRSMDGVGSMLGVLLTVVFLGTLSGGAAEVYPVIFALSAIPAVLATLAIFAIDEPAREIFDSPTRVARFRLRDLPKELKRFIVVATIFAFGQFGYAFLLLRSQGAGLSDEQTMTLYAGFYLIYSLLSTPVGALSDRIGRKRTLQLGYTIFLGVSLFLAIATELPALVVSFVLYGVFYAIVNGGQKAYVVDLCPERMKATALGAFHTATGLVALPGGVAAGLLWDALGPPATFLFGGLAALLALVLLSFVVDKREAGASVERGA